MKKSALTTIFLAAFFSVFAGNRQYVYTQIAQDKGLTSTINCIYKEKDGDVWIGTPNGLFNFDGYILTDHTDKISGSRRVFNISKDDNGKLWILTDRHIFIGHPEKEGFKLLSEDEAPYFCLYHDGEVTWIGSNDRIYRYADGRLELSHNLERDFECRTIWKIDNNLLCCSNKGKLLVDIENGRIADAPYGERNEVSASLIDKKGRIWIANYNNGIEVYEKSGRLIRRFRHDESSLSNDIVLCLAEREDAVLAGTDGGGINIINLETGKIEILSHISGDRYSFPAHSIKSLHADHYSDIWAGSVRDGLINISQSKLSFHSDTYLGQHNGLSNPTVLCLHQDRTSDMIWIGTDGEGINSFDSKTSKFRHYTSTFKTKVVSIAEYSDQELAISVYGDNIYIFDKNNGHLKPMPLTDKKLTYMLKYAGRSVNLHNEADGDLLLYSNSIYRYDRSTGGCIPIINDDNVVHHADYLTLGQTAEGVWFHDNFNIYLLENDAEHLTLKGSHSHSQIYNGHLASNGIIWMATEEGLCRFNISDGTFSHIGTTIFSHATSVVCDNRSRIWIGTENGLSAYLSESGSFAMFGDSDGVKPNEYLPKPRLLSREGDVYLGGVQGLQRIGHTLTIEASGEPVLKLKDVHIDGSPEHVDKALNLRVPRHSKYLSIAMNVRERDMFRHRVFRFSVANRIYETSTPILNLQRLPEAGMHEITVSCTRSNGEWTTPKRLLTLDIPQPWYLTWWFIGVIVLLLLLMYIMTIININKKKSNELKMAVKEQEQKVYEEKVQMLINISHELRTPLTLIMAPLKRLLKLMNSDDGTYQVLSRIYRQSRRMRGLLDMVLDLRKMEVGGNRLNITTKEFNTWIADAADDIVNEEKAEGIEIVYDFDQNVGQVEFDCQKLDTVLTNILINAIKHSAAGDKISIKTEASENGMVRISISDQGPGLGNDIDPEKMFTPFYQSKSEKYGSGIGLSYSRILVEMHGGNIGVYDNEDRGATFWWEIPAITASKEDNESRAYLNELLCHSSEADITTVSETAFNLSGTRLMIVDDNQDLLEFLREALCENFAEIVTVTGGHAALQEISSGKLPDIIVSDVNMPEGDGFWLCNELKGNEKYCHIPFVLLTARGEDQSQSESYRLGADGFLAKPFEIETLLELMRRLLRNKAEIRKRYLDNDEAYETGYGSNEEKFIIQLNRIISENLGNPALDQQLICHELGVSRALLYNRMKAITGAGAKEYITKIRIEKAKSLIETTSLTIAEISDMTGFASQSYFSTAFKNYEGMTPSAYKVLRRKSGENQ